MRLSDGLPSSTAVVEHADSTPNRVHRKFSQARKMTEESDMPAPTSPTTNPFSTSETAEGTPHPDIRLQPERNGNDGESSDAGMAVDRQADTADLLSSATSGCSDGSASDNGLKTCGREHGSGGAVNRHQDLDRPLRNGQDPLGPDACSRGKSCQDDHPNPRECGY